MTVTSRARSAQLRPVERAWSDSEDEEDAWWEGEGGSRKGPSEGPIGGDEERRKLEADFDGLLAEYSDDEIGELEDPCEGGATRGQLEVRPPCRCVSRRRGWGELRPANLSLHLVLCVQMEGDEYLDEVLDNFLKARLDSDDEGEESEGEGQGTGVVWG